MSLTSLMPLLLLFDGGYYTAKKFAASSLMAAERSISEARHRTPNLTKATLTKK